MAEAQKYKRVWMVIEKESGLRTSNISTGTSIYLRRADAIKLLNKCSWHANNYYVQGFDLIPNEDTFDREAVLSPKLEDK